MFRQRFIPCLLFVLIVFTGAENVLSEPFMPDTLAMAGEKLVLNGRGERTKLFITLYEAGLYLQEKSRDAQSIIEADRPMAMRLIIESSMITSQKMEKATLEGFEKSTGGNTVPLEKEIREFISVFREEIKEKDIYEMLYRPGSGVVVQKNGQVSALISGLVFKKALFGIWLGPNSVQTSLKTELLGNVE